MFALHCTSLAVMLACVGCNASSETGEPAPADVRSAPAGPRDVNADGFPLKAEVELRPLADHSEFARAVAKGPLPAGVRASTEHFGRTGANSEVVLVADDRATLALWSRTFATQMPANLRVAYKRTAPTKPVTLANPVPKGWQLHFVQTDDGFVVRGATVDIATSTNGVPRLELQLSQEDGVRFGDLSERLVDFKLAILVGDRVLSAPVVNERIGGGRISIAMGAAGRALADAQKLFGQLVRPKETGAR